MANAPLERQPRQHELKTWVNFYWDVVAGEKNFEVRKNDRDFQVGDILILQEYDHLAEEYTGRQINRVVTYVLSGGEFGIQEGYCVMGLSS